MKSFALILLLSFPAIVEAQQTKLEKTADVISYMTVVAQISADTAHNWKSENRKTELTKEVVSIGITVGLSELIKRFVHEERPDHSDNKSFWSEHTALAASVSGWNNKIGISLTVGTGLGRVVARKHFIWDVLAGAGIGTLSQAIVK
jgi:membrane-associated phospholipid phosphatase